jgi:hypothetical protein
MAPLLVAVVAVDRPEGAGRLDPRHDHRLEDARVEAWIAPGARNAAGSNPQRAELDVEAVRRVASSFGLAGAGQGECGDLVAAPSGAWSLGRRARAGDVIAGRHPGRRDADQITLFGPGVAMEDVPSPRARRPGARAPRGDEFRSDGGTEAQGGWTSS